MRHKENNMLSTTPIIYVILLVCVVNGKTIKSSPSSPIVIAHRGASGYLPEHTLAAKALAYGQGADYLEQDVVLSRDNIPVILHDIYLDEVTDVATVFPEKRRSDGRFYAIDLTVEQIKTLRATERFNHNTNKSTFPNRFPSFQSRFSIVTLAEELEFIAGLNKQALHWNKKQIGPYVEIKDPEFHKNENRKNISEIVLKVLADHNYTKRTDKVFLQCFDIDELQRIRNVLKSDLKLVALLTDNQYRTEASRTDYTYWNSEAGIEDMSRFVDGIGPSYAQLVERPNSSEPSVLLKTAQKHQLFVHPYTFRADRFPNLFPTFEDLLTLFIEKLKIDGLFIDHPDRAVQYLQSRKEETNQGVQLKYQLSIPLLLLLFVIRL